MKTFEMYSTLRSARARRTGHRTLGVVAAAVALGFAGCSDDPAGPSGFQASGIVVSQGSTLVAIDSVAAQGSFSVTEGESTAEMTAVFISTADNKRAVPTESGYTLDWTVTDGTIASIQRVSAWSFKVQGIKAGSTGVVFKLMSNGSAVFTSRSFPIVVNPAARGLAVGDTATFSFRDRDTANQPVAGSEKKKVWIVEKLHASLYDSTNVLEIRETTYDAAGTTVLEQDTVYLRYGADGSLYQYDLLRRLLTRVSNGDAFSSSLSPLWVKVSNPTVGASASWSSIAGDSQQVKNVTADGIPVALDITFRVAAQHKGTQAATVPAGSYGDAVHTDQALRLVVKPSSLPITALNDSLMLRYDVSPRDGMLRQIVESKILVARVLTVTQTLPVAGFDMELVAVARKK